MSLPDSTAEEACLASAQPSVGQLLLLPPDGLSRGTDKRENFTEEGAKPRGDGFHSFPTSSNRSRCIMSPLNYGSIN